MIKGTPYWSYVDTINEFNPAKDVGNIPHGNLCVTGRTKILTRNGYKRIEDIAGRPQEVWDGAEFVNAPIYQTGNGKKQEIRRVVLSTGQEVETTLYHRWYVLKNGADSSKTLDALINSGSLDIVETQNLQPGMTIVRPEMPVIHGGIEFKDAFEKGTKFLTEDVEIPVGDYKLKHKTEFLDGILSSLDKDARFIKIKSKSKARLLTLQLFLGELGTHSSVSITAGSDNLFTLTISDLDRNILEKLGVTSVKEFKKPGIVAIHSPYIVAVIDDKVSAYTYCGTSPKRETLIFNGILTMNCMESFSVVTEDFAHSCNLLSIVSPRVEEEELEEIVSMSVDILDSIVDITTTPIERAAKHNEAFRVLGIGYLGFADWMAKHNLSYESEKDLKEVSKYFEKCSLIALKASINLAKEKGSFPMYDKSEWAKGKLFGKPAEWYAENAFFKEEWKELYKLQRKHGVRNLQLFAIAPNSSTGLVQGVTPSILPSWDLLYMDSSSLGNLVKMPLYIKEKQWYYKPYKHYDRFKMNSFVSTVQNWIDSGISYEVVFDLEVDTIKDIAEFYIDAWHKGIKTVYYIRWIQPSGDVSEKEECLFCAN